MKNIFKINLENLEPVVELPEDDFSEEQEELESVDSIVSNDDLISEEVQEYDELTSDVELVENLNNTLENQLENNQASDASLEMYHVAMEQVFRKYNIPYKNNVVSTEDYSVTTVSLEKQKGFLSGLKEGIWNVIVKVYNAIKEFFKKIFNMIFRKGKAKAQEIHKDVKQNEKVYEIAYQQFASGDKELEEKVEEQPKPRTKLDVKFGYVKINPIIAPTRVTDGDFNKFREEFKTTFNGFFHHNGFELISQDFDDVVESEKEYNETLKKHTDVVTKYNKSGSSSVSDEIMDSYKKLIDINDEYLKSGGGFTNSVKNMVERFTANPIPGINVTTTEEGRLHITEVEDRNKIEMLPVCHPSDIKNYVYKLHDALDEMSKLEKKINSFDFNSLMERRKEHESKMDELHQKLAKDGHGDVSTRASNSFKKHNKVLMVYFTNLGTVLKYNSKYINSLVDYFDEVNRVFKRVSPYVGTAK